MKRIALVFLAVAGLSGCVNAAYHKRQVSNERTDTLTVGKVQREIKVGMASAQVAEILGAPNVVSTDEERREVWIYDKVSTDVVYSQSEGLATLLLIGTDRSSGAQTTTQKTLTVIIKYDTDGKVRDFAYHTSKF